MTIEYTNADRCLWQLRAALDIIARTIATLEAAHRLRELATDTTVIDASACAWAQREIPQIIECANSAMAVLTCEPAASMRDIKAVSTDE